MTYLWLAVLSAVIIVAIVVAKSKRKNKFKKWVYYVLKNGEFVEQPPVTAKEEAMNTLENTIIMKHPSGRLRTQFIRSCWILHVKFNPEKYVSRNKISERINRRLKDGRGWRSAVLEPASNRGQFTNNK